MGSEVTPPACWECQKLRNKRRPLRRNSTHLVRLHNNQKKANLPFFLVNDHHCKYFGTCVKLTDRSPWLFLMVGRQKPSLLGFSHLSRCQLLVSGKVFLPTKKTATPKELSFQHAESLTSGSHIFELFDFMKSSKTPWQCCENVTFLGLWKRDPLKMVKFKWPTQRLGMKFGHGFAWGQVKKNCLYLMDRRLSIQSETRWCVLNRKNLDIPKCQSRSIKFKQWSKPGSSGFAPNTFGKVGKVLRFCRGLPMQLYGDYYFKLRILTNQPLQGNGPRVLMPLESSWILYFNCQTYIEALEEHEY